MKRKLMVFFVFPHMVSVCWGSHGTMDPYLKNDPNHNNGITHYMRKITQRVSLKNMYVGGRVVRVKKKNANCYSDTSFPALYAAHIQPMDDPRLMPLYPSVFFFANHNKPLFFHLCDDIRNSQHAFIGLLNGGDKVGLAYFFSKYLEPIIDELLIRKKTKLIDCEEGDVEGILSSCYEKFEHLKKHHFSSSESFRFHHELREVFLASEFYLKFNHEIDILYTNICKNIMVEDLLKHKNLQNNYSFLGDGKILINKRWFLMHLGSKPSIIQNISYVLGQETTVQAMKKKEIYEGKVPPCKYSKKHKFVNMVISVLSQLKRDLVERSFEEKKQIISILTQEAIEMDMNPILFMEKKGLKRRYFIPYLNIKHKTGDGFVQPFINLVGGKRSSTLGDFLM